MIEFQPKPGLLSALGVLAALFLAAQTADAQPKIAPPKTGSLKPLAVTAPQYRALLQKAFDDLAPLAVLKTQSGQKKPLAAKNSASKTPVAMANGGAVGAIVGRLDANFAVRRSDGQVQSTTGNFWSSFGRSLNVSRLTPPSEIRVDARRARAALRLQMRALDKWSSAPIYQPVDAGKIVAALEASGQIRVGPLWWQQALANAKGALSRAWQSFANWINGLFPKMTPFKNTAAPSDKLLWLLFYCLVTAVLGAIFWFLWRTFGGKILSRRATRRDTKLENEDAELLQLPPAELLSRAARFAAQGNFREALRHRYLSLLLDLDARGVWRYDARRTNWEHIAALGRSATRRELVAPLSELTKSFDRVRYGGAPCDDQGWQDFDAAAHAFENQAAPLQKSLARESEAQSPREKELVR